MPLDLLVFELPERTSPIYSGVGSHGYLLSVFLCHLDEPVKLLPVSFIKMVFIYFATVFKPAYLVMLLPGNVAMNECRTRLAAGKLVLC